MSKTNPTNKELADRFDEFERSMRKEMREFRDFMVIQIDRQKRANGNPGMMGIIKQAITTMSLLGDYTPVVINAENAHI